MTTPASDTSRQRRRLVALLLLGWIVAFALSFVLAWTTTPTGDSFTRGLNRIMVFAGWQFGAVILALVTWLVGWGRFQHAAGWRWASRVPIIGELLLVLFFVGVIGYVTWLKPKPSPEPSPGVPAQVASPAEVDFPGFDPVDRQLQEAIIHFSAIADQLQLAAQDEIDAPTTVQRIDEIKDALRALRASWTEQAPADRIAARARLAAAMARLEERLAAATTRFQERERPDHRVVQALAVGPIWNDFLREPPYETFRGIYQSGFEISHFHSLDEPGMFWAETNPDVWEQIQEHFVERPGRGSGIHMAITFKGYREDAGGYGHASSYASRVFIESIDAIRPLTVEEFELIRQQMP